MWIFCSWSEVEGVRPMSQLIRSVMFVMIAIMGFIAATGRFAQAQDRAGSPSGVREAIIEVVSKDQEERNVVVLVEWFGDTNSVTPRAVESVTVSATKPYKFVGVVGQTYRLSVVEPSTKFVRNRRVLLRASGFTVKLPALARPTVEERIAELQIQVAVAQAETRDRLIELAIANADKRALEKQLETVRSNLSAAQAANQEAQQTIWGLVASSVVADAKINALTLESFNARNAQAKAESEAVQVKTEVVNLTYQLTAAQQQGEVYRQLVVQLDSKSDAQEIELEQLRAEVGALKNGNVTGRGLTGGVNYTGSWDPRLRDPWDTPVYVDLINDSIYQTRVGEVQILFSGRPVHQQIAPFSVTLREENDWFAPWGGSHVVQAFPRPDLGGWVAVVGTNKFIDAKGNSRPRISFDSRTFDVQEGADNQVSVQVIGTYSFDGVSVQTGPDHGSGTVVVSYRE